jgi:signal transduction histidine kinase
MKLAAYYNRANIIITLSVLFIGAVIYYFAINYIAQKQLDHYLTEETEEATDFIAQHHKLPLEYDLEDQQTFFEKTSRSSIPISFFDTTYADSKAEKTGPGRAEITFTQFNGQNYKTIVIISRANTENFTKLIACITLALTIGLLVTLFITNRYLLNGLWRPFYATLREMKAFNVNDGKSFEQHKGSVDEFNELNEAVQSMAVRVKNDFHHLKQFTENASHEMMTPLAVITSKLDILIQDETLNPGQFEQLTDIYTATGKLSRLNQSLLLLVKIENNLIHDEETLNIDQMVTEKLRHFHELIEVKNITLEKQLHPKQIIASRYLTDILLNNLIGNAIRHNVEHGNLFIILTNNLLILQNTGATAPLDAEMIFERFRKGQKSEGTGLGLAIVKNICNMYGWKISYDHNMKMHTFQVVF